MIVKILTLEGNSYKITFNDDITINKIKQKLLLEYNFNAEQCIFCLDGKTIYDELIPKESFALMKPEITIVAINHQMCLEKSYPKVDNAFHFNFSRYFDDFVPEITEQKNENQSNNCDLNNSFINISESEPNASINNILTTDQFNEESNNHINSNDLIQIDQQELEPDTIMGPFTTILNELQELRRNIELISENITNMSLSGRNESERNMQILESLNINIEFTEEDNQSIMRLVSAGHDRVNAIQIFVICDKNEEMALNLLSTIE